MREVEQREYTHRSEEVGEWHSVIAGERPELSGCSRERSDGACRFTDYYDAHYNRCSGIALSCAEKQVDVGITSG
jgi:hypothetical protein